MNFFLFIFHILVISGIFSLGLAAGVVYADKLKTAGQKFLLKIRGER